jgi:hypothetical protein
MACGVLYIIGKVSERRCLKWARIAHLDIWNTSYGQKKGWELTRFSCVQMACNIPWKALNEAYNFASNLISIRSLYTKLWRPKVAGVPTLTISGLPLGSLETKNHLDVGPMERCKVYYKGEGGGFPQVRVVVNLVCICCLWLVLAPKVLQLCTNHLALVLCKSVWVSEACQLFLVPSRNSNTPLYPSKVLRTRERAPTPYSSVVFCLGLTFESFKELGVRQNPWKNIFRALILI